MRYAHHNIIYGRLGLRPEAHLPAQGAPSQVIDVADPRFGPEFMCVSIDPPQGGKHRVMAHCYCGRAVPIGRLGQHRKACKDFK